jgi:hypothetical protein
MSWTLPTLIRPRERLQLLPLVLCIPWWTSPVCASTWAQSSPPSANDEPQPILCQILLNFVAIVNNTFWVCWLENVGSMPSLHWYCCSFLKQIFNCFADFATDFGNGNFMFEAPPITKLNISALKSALTVLKTFCSHQINLHQAIMTTITVMPGSVTAYTVSPWNNTQACGPRKDERNSPTDGASHPISNTTSTPDRVTEASATLQHLIRTRTIPLAVRGKGSLIVG